MYLWRDNATYACCSVLLVEAPVERSKEKKRECILAEMHDQKPQIKLLFDEKKRSTL